jgi:adenylate kinase
MRLLIVGPPGAGKGTQAKVVAERLGIPTISTGDIFRRNLAEGTPLGLQAKGYMDAGEYVPDEVTNDMVRARLAEDDAAGGFLLDGYPRTVAQVHALDDMLAQSGLALDRVVELVVDTDAVVARLLKRAEIEGRADDNEATIRRRMEVYAEQTAPLLAVYRERGILVQVDGMGDIEEITDRVLASLDGAG